MIVYQSTKEGFLSDVLNNEIDSKIKAAFISHLGRSTSQSEVLSWTNSMMHMNNVLNDSEIAPNAKVSIEYQLPLTSRRIDFILTGLNEYQVPQVVIVELKQWSCAQLSDLPSMVRTRFKQGILEKNHPSYQAWSYAAYLQDFSKIVQEDNINLIPCAYLHNYIPDNIITSEVYEQDIKNAPLFLRPDAIKLREFIKKFVKYGDDKDIMYKIENGKLRPSKQLADYVSSMLAGNHEFILLDEQKYVYEKALQMAQRAKIEKKQVLIVEGGPGTGKSVVAVNLLVELIKRGLMTRYVSKNSAPRDVYTARLSGTIRKSKINSLFGGTGNYWGCDKNTFDALVVDEAHRLNLKSGLFRNQGENQVLELLDASKCTIFFIDNDQRIHIKDIGDSERIEKWAKNRGAVVQKLKLESQFRCNGSDGYLAWLDNMLQIRNTANFNLSRDDFDFRIFSNPNELFDIIKEKNKYNNKSRMVAGYCWDWKSKNNPLAYDVTIPDLDFKMRWNLYKDGGTWIIAEDSINEIGCIHTCQGLELDYVGVIVGTDLRCENGKIITDVKQRSGKDRSIAGIKTMLKENPLEAITLADRIIKNTYRTLMTRGMKGCYVYFCDKELATHFANQLAVEQSSGKLVLPEIVSIPKWPRVEPEVNDNVKYVDFLPIYSIQAACGAFGEGQDAEELGWVKIEGLGKLNKNMFVVQAKGDSMEPRIPDGSLCVFRTNVVGSRNNKIVLVQHRDTFDSDHGGSYSIKTYTSEKSFDKETGEWMHERIVLKPLNAEFAPITILEDDNFSVIGEFIGVVKNEE